MPDTSKREFETPQVMHDAPLRDDDAAHFHFDDFAVTLARLIAAKGTRTPLTIGVSGPWGSGKTTLLRRVRKMLDDAGDLSDATKIAFVNGDEVPQDHFRRCRTVWFDAWKYAGEDHLLAALIRVILATMARGKLDEKFWGKLLDKDHPRFNVIATFLSFFKFKADDVEFGFDIEKYKTETPFAQNKAFLDFFDEAFEELLARWVHGKGDPAKIDEQTGALVVFIDDLDRCLPDKMVQVLEAIKLFLDKLGCVFVLGADVGIVQQAVAKYYKDTGVTGESAGDYLEKVIQLRFELPQIADAEMQQYLDAERRAVDDETRRNWQTIVAGAETNPRKVKTSVNDLNLRWAMLKNSGQAAGVNRGDFTRWQVLLRAAPADFIKQIDNLDDFERRHSFIVDALKWVAGEASVAASFRQYEGSSRLRRVLREIKAFSDQFTPAALKAFMQLTAPPPIVPAAEKPGAVVEGEARIVAKAMLKAEGEVVPLSGKLGIEGTLTGVKLRRFDGIDFVPVPAGKFVMGSKDDNSLAGSDEKPQHTVEIPYDYWLARFPTTNAEFAKFVEATGRKHEWPPDWKEKLDHPVVQVSWHDAIEYCKWLSRTLKTEIGDLEIRLPSEAEWEKAARGEYGNEWPWGNEFDKNKCNSREGGKGTTTPVGAYSPQGDSPYGAVDMAGNVWEWCHSLFKPYPYDANDGRESGSVSGDRVLRGGAFDYYQGYARAAARLGFVADDRNDNVGWRLVVAPRLS